MKLFQHKSKLHTTFWILIATIIGFSHIAYSQSFEITYGQNNNLCKCLLDELKNWDVVPVCDAVNFRLKNTKVIKWEEINVLKYPQIVKPAEKSLNQTWFKNNPGADDWWFKTLQNRMKDETNKPQLFRFKINPDSDYLTNLIFAYRLDQTKCIPTKFNNWTKKNAGLLLIRYNESHFLEIYGHGNIIKFNGSIYMIKSYLTSRTHYHEWVMTINKITENPKYSKLTCYIRANKIYPPPPKAKRIIEDNGSD